jgi:glycosyltransferase involved in cell wall biosynthesis
MAKSEELIEPDFSTNGREVVVVSTDQQVVRDDYEVDTCANVILLSYNRPRMIKEAIDSVVNQTYNNWQLHILDDGSDFDINDIINEYKDNRIVAYKFPPISIAARAERSRVAANINYVLDTIPSDEIIHYLCDDDLLHPQWISRSAIALNRNPLCHMAQGQTWTFYDGDDWRVKSVQGMPGMPNSNIPQLFFGTGTFCNLNGCFHEEKITWHDNSYSHSQDIAFIDDMTNRHPSMIVLNTPSIIRREHDNSLSSRLGRKDKDGRYTPGFIPGKAKAESLMGWME